MSEQVTLWPEGLTDTPVESMSIEELREQVLLQKKIIDNMWPTFCAWGEMHGYLSVCTKGKVEVSVREMDATLAKVQELNK